MYVCAYVYEAYDLNTDLRSLALAPALKRKSEEQRRSSKGKARACHETRSTPCQEHSDVALFAQLSKYRSCSNLGCISLLILYTVYVMLVPFGVNFGVNFGSKLGQFRACMFQVAWSSGKAPYNLHVSIHICTCIRIFVYVCVCLCIRSMCT